MSRWSAVQKGAAMVGVVFVLVGLLGFIPESHVELRLAVGCLAVEV